LQKII